MLQMLHELTTQTKYELPKDEDEKTERQNEGPKLEGCSHNTPTVLRSRNFLEHFVDYILEITEEDEEKFVEEESKPEAEEAEPNEQEEVENEKNPLDLPFGM